MPHPLFAAIVREMEPIRAERLLDAAQAASVPHMGKEAARWWDRTVAAARGLAREIVERAGPLFTFNSRPINSSAGLRAEFNQHVSGGKVTD
jgi:hypothetical protein